MKPFGSHITTFFAPLIVMLLLTILMGWTGYQLINRWYESAEKTTRYAVEAVMVTNIRWGLYQVQQAMPDHPDEARRLWNELRQQAGMLAQDNPQNANYQMLEKFLAQGGNMHKVGPLLERDFLNVKLGETRQSLTVLHEHSQFVALAMTLCMLVLGTVLMGITAWDLKRLIRALVRSRDLNISLQEEERRRIAQELHDGSVQALIDLKRHYSPEKVDGLIDNLRRVCHNLKPQVLDDLGLPAALEFLADDLRQAGLNQVTLNLDADGLQNLPKQYELPLFRVIQELCSNIKHHSQAQHATLTVIYNPDESPLLRGYVTDNGKGFNVKESVGQGLGLTGVRERIEQVGGRLVIESTPGHGSQFQFFIPVDRHASLSA